MLKALVAALVAFAASLYPLSGFHAAWGIREAARTGDTATLDRRVDWASVRQSLKRSAGGETRQLISEMSATAGVPAPGIWQRFKAAALPFVADPLIDRYVTAEGAPQLWAWRQTWREKIRPKLLSEPATLLAGSFLENSSLDRMLSTARRVERVAFTSLRRMELELVDRFVPDRRWQATLELRDWSWMLTEVHMRRGVAVPAIQGGSLVDAGAATRGG